MKGSKWSLIQPWVADFSSGIRKLRRFPNAASARAQARKVATLLAAGEVHAAQLRGPDASAYGRALELLKPTGDPIELVAARYAESVQLLGGGASLADPRGESPLLVSGTAMSNRSDHEHKRWQAVPENDQPGA